METQRLGVYPSRQVLSDQSPMPRSVRRCHLLAESRPLIQPITTNLTEEMSQICGDMASIDWKEWFAKYKSFVAENPEAVGNIESAVRILSYLVPGTRRKLIL